MACVQRARSAGARRLRQPHAHALCRTCSAPRAQCAQMRERAAERACSRRAHGAAQQPAAPFKIKRAASHVWTAGGSAVPECDETQAPHDVRRHDTSAVAAQGVDETQEVSVLIHD
eukprot:6207857-Pleurochrysis_carterae.AAC.1